MIYKVLSADGHALTKRDFQWSLPTQNPDGTWTPGEWHEAEGKVRACRNGLHGTTVPLKYYEWGCQVFLMEGEGEEDREGDKVAFQRARLLRPQSHPQWWLNAIAFVESISSVRFFEPDGQPTAPVQLPLLAGMPLIHT